MNKKTDEPYDGKLYWKVSKLLWLHNNYAIPRYLTVEHTSEPRNNLSLYLCAQLCWAGDLQV